MRGFSFVLAVFVAIKLADVRTATMVRCGNSGLSFLLHSGRDKALVVPVGNGNAGAGSFVLGFLAKNGGKHPVQDRALPEFRPKPKLLGP